MKQSELHRDIFEPGWREKEQAHYAKLIDAVPTVKQSLQVQAMTTQTAESVALELEEDIDGFPQATTLERKAAAMLRSQAAEIERLRRALEKIAMTEYHIETPPIESLERQMRNIARAALEGK